ncbi:enoyl-CoA hydratase-related protein [Pseudonocardia sp. GCM10023141]|uniref:enoyl-CoA hydratase-related protein n=1 Tax=Pseudonocardia sp. GCM10023141 TaxID=3252653 RepID=UPI00361166A9
MTATTGGQPVIHEDVDENGVAELVIDNPPVNAFNVADIGTLIGHLRKYAHDERIRAVVLRANGRGFCGGGDVKEVQRKPGFAGILGQTWGSLELTLAIAECPVPVVGAIHGYCIGLGVLVAGVCDILLAAPDTPFVLAEADNGATSGIVQAIGLMPDKRLRAAMFTCEPVDSAELLRFGSVLRLVPAHELAADARAVATTIARKRTNVIRGLKSAMAGTIGRDIRTHYRQELSYTFELNMSGEARDARGDFVDGRRTGYLDD